jgi:hypothetical protein
MVLCRFFQQGRCRNGDSCTFEHPTTTTRTPQLCIFFQKGTCKYGTACRDAHDTGASGAPKAKDPRSIIPCTFFLRNACNMGALCPYSHGSAAPVFANTLVPAAQGQSQQKSTQQEPRDGPDNDATNHQNLSRTIAGAHVTFGQGAAVSEISLPSDYSTLTLTNLPICLGEEDTRDILERWTDRTAIESIVARADPQTSTKSAIVKVADQGRARKAVLNGASSLKAYGSTIAVRTTQVGESGLGTNRLKLSTVACSWYEPSMKAELQYRTATEARQTLLEHSENPRELHGRQLTLNRGHFASVIEVRNLAVQTTEEDLCRYFNQVPPQKIVLGKISHSRSPMELRNHVKALLEEYGKLVEWSVSNKPGSASTCAFGKFSNSDAPLRAVENLDGTHIDPVSNDKLHIRHIVSVKLPVSQRILRAIRQQLPHLAETSQSTLSVFIKVYDNPTKAYTQIKVSGGNKTSVSQVKGQLESLLAATSRPSGCNP